jgi:hypothetical protein
MTPVRHFAKKLSRFMVLIACCALTACGSLADHVVKRAPEGAVILERLPARGTTIRYSGQLKSFRASHPVSLSPELVSRILSGIHVGIAPSEGDRSTTGIKPTPLFSSGEVAFLAPPIAAALEQAEPDQRVKFEVGPESERSSGALYVEDRTMRFTLSHFHSAAHRRDENLSIYILSMQPEQAQEHTAAARWMREIEPDRPQLAVHYGRLEALFQPDPHSSARSAPAATAPVADNRSLKEVVDKQAQELEALKAELEALKKRTESQRPSAPSKPMP